MTILFGPETARELLPKFLICFSNVAGTATGFRLLKVFDGAVKCCLSRVSPVDRNLLERKTIRVRPARLLIVPAPGGQLQTLRARSVS